MLSNDFGSRQFRPVGKKWLSVGIMPGLLGPTLVTELQCRTSALRNFVILTVRIVPSPLCFLNISDAFPPARSQE